MIDILSCRYFVYVCLFEPVLIILGEYKDQICILEKKKKKIQPIYLIEINKCKLIRHSNQF